MENRLQAISYETALRTENERFSGRKINHESYAAPGTRGSRLEYVQRVLVSYYTTAAAVRIL